MKPKRKANHQHCSNLTVNSLIRFPDRDIRAGMQISTWPLSFHNRWEMPSLRICSEHRTRVWPNGFHRGDEMTKVSEHLTSWGPGVCRIWIVTCRVNRASPEKTAAAVCVHQHWAKEGKCVSLPALSPSNCPQKVKPPRYSISLALTKQSHSSSDNMQTKTLRHSNRNNCMSSF